MMSPERNWDGIMIFLAAILAYLAFEFGRIYWIRRKRRKQKGSFRRMKSAGQIARERAGRRPDQDHR